ncbi:hypothetical protein QNK12_14150 [Neobacillus cucumis]|nr:hypothetical protein QNK12_14150 [Neobacillus cucumis]
MNILFASNNTEVINKAVSEGLAITFLMDIALKDDLNVKSGEIIKVAFSTNNVHSSYSLLQNKKLKFAVYNKKKKALKSLPSSLKTAPIYDKVHLNSSK